MILTNGIKERPEAPRRQTRLRHHQDGARLRQAPSARASRTRSLNGVCQLTGHRSCGRARPRRFAPRPGRIPRTSWCRFSFTTESTRDTFELLTATSSARPADPITVKPTGLNTAPAEPRAAGRRRVRAGAQHSVLPQPQRTAHGVLLARAALPARSRPAPSLTRFNPCRCRPRRC